MRLLLAILIAALACLPATAAIIKATYLFNGSLAAGQAGAPALQPVDPLGASGFVQDTVFGKPRTVYEFNGYPASPDQQAGLTFSNAGKVVDPQSYSIELIFQFFSEGSYRRVVDVSNRTADSGLYVNWFGALDAYPVNNGLAALTANTYYHVVFTNDSLGRMTGYVDGVLDLEGEPSVMNIQDPDQIISFFLDNTVDGATDEYSSGRVALIRLYDGVLSKEGAAALARDPFGGLSVPEPRAFVLAATGLAALGLLRRRRHRSQRGSPAPSNAVSAKPYWFDRLRS